MSALLERSSRLTSELQRLTELLDDLSNGYNPNNQDMAVKGVVMDYRKWRRAGGDTSDVADDEAAKVEFNAQLDSLLDEGAWPASSVQELSDRDPLELMEDDDYPADPKDSGIRECVVVRPVVAQAHARSGSVSHPRVPARRRRAVL